MDRNQSHANGWEPARATAGELMLLKHNYLDGWLQTYIVDLEERRLPEYADMCVIGMLHRAITHAMTNAKSKFRGRSCTKIMSAWSRATQVPSPPVLATNTVHERATGDNCNH